MLTARRYGVERRPCSSRSRDLLPGADWTRIGSLHDLAARCSTASAAPRRCARSRRTVGEAGYRPADERAIVDATGLGGTHAAAARLQPLTDLLDTVLASVPQPAKSRSADHRLPWPLHDRAGGTQRVPRAADWRGSSNRGSLPSNAASSPTTRSARRSRPTSSSCSKQRGADLTIFSPARVGDGPPPGRRGGLADWSRGLQRPDQARRRPLSRQLRRRLPAAAIAGRADRRVDRRARALRDRAGVRRLQPEPRSLGRTLDLAAAHRPPLVPVLRTHGRAGRAGHGPRLARRAIRTSTRPARTTSTPTRRRSCSSSRATCSRISRRCASSFRTAAAPCRITGAATGGSPTCSSSRTARRARDAQCLLRHVRLPPARASTCCSGSSTSRTSCSARRWSARCAASTRRPVITSTTPSATSTPLPITDAERAQVFEGNARRVYPRLDAILKARTL